MRIQRDNINSKDHWEREYVDNKLHSLYPDDLKNFLFASYITDGSKIIDLGCGVGQLCEQIYRMRPHCDIWGMDFSSTGIVEAKTRVPSGKFIEGDILDSGLDDKSFDYVLNSEVLEHLEDPEKLVAEMARLTRYACLVTTPFGDHIPSAEHIQLFDYQEIRGMFEKYFRTVFVFPLASGRIVYNPDKTVKYPQGNWDEISIVATV